jgi:hypothetical protein
MSLPHLDPVVVLVLRGAGALLWLSAFLHKARAPARFRSALWDYALLPPAAVDAVAGALIAVEGGLAVALLVPAAAPRAALASAGLLALYGLAIGWNLLRGRRDLDCGCGGAGGPQPLGPALVVRNAVAAALFVLAAAPGTGRGLTVLDAVTAPAAVVVLALLWCAADLAIANGARLRARTRGERGGKAWTTP